MRPIRTLSPMVERHEHTEGRSPGRPARGQIPLPREERRSEVELWRTVQPGPPARASRVAAEAHLLLRATPKPLRRSAHAHFRGACSGASSRSSRRG
ncbi:hypothetical protein F2P81_014888 [Scophthalmus maximus]|uniref:Uncharacterized protein n=1 Tax=Scophthalmus maximus TaxID=52904 RepID=A0A6A4SKB6_SCOMX|nr:hypothetical protein F2P81_014888 [Scophthalmus maximus]